jgi:hypothetical protein
MFGRMRLLHLLKVLQSLGAAPPKGMLPIHPLLILLIVLIRSEG